MIKELLTAGLIALKDYIATHVLTCLIPAFLLAGAMVTFISREAFSLAGFSSIFIAACSCTVIPVASGLYYSGAGIGVAFIILWVSPASNILSLIYTGSILGGEIVIARIVAAFLMAFVVGGIMSYIFRGERVEATSLKAGREKGSIIAGRELILLLIILATLLLPNYLVRSGPYLYKIIVWAVPTLVMAIYAWKAISPDRVKNWMRETW